MKKIKIGVSKEIDFKLKNFKKNLIFNKINFENFSYDAIIITSNTKINYKIINKSKKIRVIFIMSLHLLSKIELNKINKNVKILYFYEKSKYILKKINPTPEFIFGLIILLVKFS